MNFCLRCVPDAATSPNPDRGANRAMDPHESRRTILVYYGDVSMSNKVVRQSVSLPAETARQVRGMAKKRRLSANRVIVELVEEGIEARRRKRREFFELAQRFRSATDPKDIERLGDELGSMVFGE
jgi:hypothetical protein